MVRLPLNRSGSRGIGGGSRRSAFKIQDWRGALTRPPPPVTFSRKCRSRSLPAFDPQTRQPSRRPLSGVRPCAPVSRDRQEANAPSVPATQRLLAVPKFAIPKRPRSKSTWMSSFQPIRSPHRPANSMFHSDVSASGLKNLRSRSMCGTAFVRCFAYTAIPISGHGRGGLHWLMQGCKYLPGRESPLPFVR